MRYITHLRRYLSEQNVSILHTRSRLPAWISYLAWKGMDPEKRPRFVTTVHGPYTVNRYSRIMTRGQRVIAISEFIREYILGNYPEMDKNKIEVIHRGVSYDQFPYGYRPSDEWISAWEKQHPALSGKYVVTLPARITRWKGHEDFVEILRLALSKGLPIHGLVAGAPHLRRTSFYNELKTKATEAGLVDHITFLGHRDDLREILAISDVILSLAKKPEAFGRTALESLCLGTPVIAYNHGGTAEVMGSIFPGGCIKPHDINAAVDKLKAFFNKPPVIPNNNPFTLGSMLNKTIMLYKIISENGDYNK